jgi:hydroxyacylglutathione hydrolase
MATGAMVVRITNRGFASNTYLCRTSTAGQCIVIDPGLDTDAIDATLEREGLVPRAVFCTHGHFDHIGSVEHIRIKYDVPAHLHVSDAKVARSSNFLMMAFKIPGRVDVPRETRAMVAGLVWSDGSDKVECVHVPGHTPGSCVVRFGNHAFTGDTIYRDTIDLVSLPGEDRAALVRSIRELWERLPDDTEIHPGHGGGGEFGRVKRDNRALRRLVGLDPEEAS